MKCAPIYRLTLLAFMAGFFVSAPLAHGDTVALTLLNPNQSALRGTTLSFDASVSAPSTNSGIEYLNGDEFTVSLPIDDSGYLNDFPLDLAPGQSFTGLLFTISIPSTAAQGNYPGVFSIAGGPTGTSLGVLASAPFDVYVSPEPPALALFGTGLALLAAGASLRRRAVRVRPQA